LSTIHGETEYVDGKPEYRFKRIPGSRWNNAIIRAIDAENIKVIGEKNSVIDGVNCFDEIGEEEYRGPHGMTFFNCKELYSVSLPNNIKSIQSETFSGCAKLTDIVLPEGIYSIGKMALFKCAGLQSIRIPNNVTIIESGAFSECRNLQNITLSQSIETIDQDAFSGCKKLNSIIIPECVNVINVRSFYGCSNLQKVVISKNTTVIDTSFGLCKKLTIFAPIGSFAEQYAKENNIKFEAI
jgi:hypothetical protein